jgi:hypothetical protein
LPEQSWLARRDVPFVDLNNEIGRMARSLQVFKDHLAETTRMRTEQEAMKLRAAEDRRAVLARIADEFERSIGGVIRAPVPPPSRSWAPRPRKLPGACSGHRRARTM